MSRPLPVPPPVNRSPTVRAQCDPCRVEVGQSVTLRATSQDPDGDSVRSFWTIPTGAITDARLPTTQWRAETSPGKVTLTVTADDGRGGTASDTVTIEVIALRVLADVQFALDSAVLRPDALRTLTVALKTLNESPSITLHIEGYASPEGSSRIQQSVGREASASRSRLPDEPWDRRVATDNHELWGGAPEVRQFTGRDLALNRRAALIID